MSFKTDRLAALFPDAYAASDRAALLYKLLDAIGAELLLADAAVKGMLKSHWVNYAEDQALDGLGAIYGLTRRQLRDGTYTTEQARMRDGLPFESDSAFRLRLKSAIAVYTGGGTRTAIVGAVRSALGLPYRLSDLNLPPQLKDLEREIEDLVRLVEFAPREDRLAGSTVVETANRSELTLEVDAQTVQASRPRIEWRFTRGSGRALRLEVGAEGLQATNDLIVPPGSVLVLSGDESGLFTATLNGVRVTHLFRALDGGVPRLPAVPPGRSEWVFRAVSAMFDVAAFDRADTFDLPQFGVELVWISQEPLTFDLYVPYFLERAVAALAARRGYQGRLLVFSGLPLERIQDVVDQTRAAGVRGNVHFTLNFYDDHQLRDTFNATVSHRARETQQQSDTLTVGSLNQAAEIHSQSDRLVIGAVFDVSPFDGGHGFVV